MATLFQLPPEYRLVEYFPAEKSSSQLLCLARCGCSASCPVCLRASRRVHSRYWRTLTDLPCSGQQVLLQVRVRRFFCQNRRCPRRTFAETLPGLAAIRARRTARMQQALTKMAQAVGSRPGVRLGMPLALPVSATTLLRLERAAPLPNVETPRVLGVDDWAFKKGHQYGTILYDLEKHCPVDLLPDRTADSLAEWLKAHPGVEIISRDRGGCYAEGARNGAPHAVQVADRWHLAKNLGEALERLQDSKRSLLKEAVSQIAETANAPPQHLEASPESREGQPSRRQQRLQQEKVCHRQYRVERYETVQAFVAQGMNLSAIGRHLRLNRRTVRKLAQAQAFPERKERTPRRSKLDAYKPFLLQCWQEGCHNAAALLAEIKEKGYVGGHTLLRSFVQTLRHKEPAVPLPPHDRLSPRQVAMWTLRRAEDRTARQQSILENLEQLCAPFQKANALAQRFLTMIRGCPRQDQAESLACWIADAIASEVGPMSAFAVGLHRDQSAVEAGLSLEWSNGAVEGSNNRLKFLKRRGYGQANFDLLRMRVLQPT